MTTPAITVTSLLAHHARNCGCQMEWRGAPIEAEAVFEDSYLMPVLTTLASVRASALINWDLGVTNESSKAGLLGMKSQIPAFNRNQISDVLRGCFYIHAAEKVFGLSRGGVIECYPVYEFFNMDIQQRARDASRYTLPLAKKMERSLAK